MANMLDAWWERLIPVIRPEDHLILYFNLINLDIKTVPINANTSRGPKYATRPKYATLVKKEKGQPAYLVMILPPQNIAEEAFFETDPNFPIKEIEGQPIDPDSLNNSDPLPTEKTPPEPPVPVQSILSMPSFLVFEVPSNAKIDYTIEGLLDACSKYPLKVVPNALPPEENAQNYAMVSDVFKRVSMLKHAAINNIGGINSKLAKSFSSPIKLNHNQRANLEKHLKSWIANSTLANYVFSTEPDFFQVPETKPKMPDLESIKNATMIETPFRLILSPHNHAAWVHSLKPKRSSKTGRTELWNTRLATRNINGTVDEKGSRLRTVRAIWARDYGFDTNWWNPPNHNNEPFRMALDSFDRHNIVHLSSNYEIQYISPERTPQAYIPCPIQVDQLMLTSLGAWMKVNASWDLRDPSLSLTGWRHRATMGRDHYVRVVYKGFLFPFGHKASLVKITERKIHPEIKGNVAYLRQKMYLIVREPEKYFITTGSKTKEGWSLDRKMPFMRIEIKTLSTPNLDNPAASCYPEKMQSLFWPKIENNFFRFNLVGEDFNGHIVEFTLPLLFVASDANMQSLLYEVKNDYKNSKYSECPTFGQILTLADTPGEEDNEDVTTFETATLKFGVEIIDSVNSDIPCFYPTLCKAEISIPAIKSLAGVQEPCWIQYNSNYLINGFEDASNKGQIFADLDGKLDLDFGSQGDRSGGLIQPNMRIKGLSRIMGPVAGKMENIIQGNFKPEDFFGDLNAKLFGIIPLTEILADTNLDDLTLIPRFITEIANDETSYSFKWKPKLKDWSISKNDPPLFLASDKDINDKDIYASMDLNLITKTSSDQSKITKDIHCTLENFRISLFGEMNFIVIHFKMMEFKSLNGMKPDINVELGKIEFKGVLGFIEKIKELIPLNGFSDPPSIDITSQGITAGYSLALPSIAFGVFCLENISLGAGLTVPFQGDPLSVRLNFCERQSPFLLIVSMFGGGGYFNITITPGGVKILEAAFLFGACISIDFGVASGSVHVLGGIHYSKKDDTAFLNGSLSIGGEVDVLGLISASIELSLQLGYEFSSGKCVGRAIMTIEVEVFMFSKDVTISCERRFAGSNGDPSFEDIMGRYYIDSITGAIQEPQVPGSKEVNPWKDYCQAFAFMEA